MLQREWGAESNGNSIPGKTTILVPEFALEDLPSAELQPVACTWAEHSDDDDI